MSAGMVRWVCASPTCQAATIRPMGTSLKARCPEVVASCDGQIVRINPMTGPG